MADKSLNKTELVAAVAAASGQTQASVNEVLDALFSTLADSVASGTKVTIPGWLAVERTSRAARTGRNPQTGAPVKIAASKGVRFAPAQAFKTALNAKGGSKKAAAPAKKGGAKKAAPAKAAKKGGAKKAAKATKKR